MGLLWTEHKFCGLDGTSLEKKQWKSYNYYDTKTGKKLKQGSGQSYRQCPQCRKVYTDGATPLAYGLFLLALLAIIIVFVKVR